MTEYKVHYNPHKGTPISDGRVTEFVDAYLISGGTIEVSTENVINELRCRVKEGTVSGVTFYFNDENGCMHTIEPNTHGRLPEWPKGFCDTWDRHLDRLL
jgi:hypothetical protein